MPFIFALHRSFCGSSFPAHYWDQRYATLMVQSKFLDMRFDSDVIVITIAVLAGLWHYFATSIL